MLPFKNREERVLLLLKTEKKETSAFQRSEGREASVQYWFQKDDVSGTHDCLS